MEMRGRLQCITVGSVIRVAGLLPASEARGTDDI